jgi:hypothetical protein
VEGRWSGWAHPEVGAAACVGIASASGGARAEDRAGVIWGKNPPWHVGPVEGEREAARWGHTPVRVLGECPRESG